MDTRKGFLRRWGRELIVLFLAVSGGWLGMSTAIFAAISFGGGYGLLVLLIGRGLMFWLNAPIVFAPGSVNLIEQLVLMGEAILALWAFVLIYKKRDNVFLAGLPWMLLLGIGHGIFKGLVLDMPLKHIVFSVDKAILFSLMSLTVAFCDVFIAYLANLFLEERMYKVNQAAKNRKKEQPNVQPRRWM